MDNGWNDSAAAWIATQGEEGDFTRRAVLDPPMLARIEGRGFATALDVGCGEGRFTRLLHARGIAATGLDPTALLLDAARRRDPEGDYREGRAEALPFPDAAFDLVVSYLTLIDIADSDAAIAEMARVLRPGGTLLIANLASFATAVEDPSERAARGLPSTGWIKGPDGRRLVFAIDRYLDVRAAWAEWGDIRIVNWHRPLSAYMAPLLRAGLILRDFAEPEPDPRWGRQAEDYRRIPWAFIMEWQKS